MDRKISDWGGNIAALGIVIAVNALANILRFGGQTTVLGTKITGMHRLPASYFVSVSYMCWAYRRRKMTVQGEEVRYD